MMTKPEYKYLPTSDFDEKWGLNVLNVGVGTIPSATNYPSSRHPNSYFFNWEKGRVLSEYQIIYITQGEGVFESKSSGKINIKEGSIIILFPDEWHRYKPKEETGWHERWVGFNGQIMDDLVNHNFFRPQQPVIHVGIMDEISLFFDDIMIRSQAEKMGYQPLVSGEVLHLLGFIHSLSKNSEVDPENTDHAYQLVNRARIIFRDNINSSIVPEQLAKELGISYSLFRKLFKKHTGISPGQYFIQLKIEKAKVLLTFPNTLVKDVAYKLGFDSCFYFSKLFKEKTGVSPNKYREKYGADTYINKPE